MFISILKDQSNDGLVILEKQLCLDRNLYKKFLLSVQLTCVLRACQQSSVIAGIVMFYNLIF